MTGMIGKNFGRYQILELLGEGGMATVYKAYDTHLERDVAIKVIRRDAFPPNQLDLILKRFEREAKSLGRLSHPNIVGVIDYGEHEGSPFLVMVYLPGGTLKDRLGKPIPWRSAVQLILPIAYALEYVHEHNIINRDVKPSNILMTEKGQPMLTDFGLVKLFEGREQNLTASGDGIGTPDYMAPEQWIGETTVLSDMYSLGVVLYEMITGHRPYMADTPAGVLLKQINEPLPLPNEYIPNLPKNIESVLLKVLAREPKDRYPDMRTFAYELQSLVEGRDPIASTIRTEKLREQMTGKVKKHETEEVRRRVEQIKKEQAGPPPVKKKTKIPVWMGVIGAFVFLLLCGGCWLIYSNLGSLAVKSPNDLEQPSPVASSTETSPVTPVTPTEVQVLSTATSSIPVEIRDSKNVLMRIIPDGEFTMGSDDGDSESRPENLVSVSTFYIDKYEVTNELYAACVFAGKCRRPLQEGSNTRGSYYSEPEFANYPVLFVDWKMANSYCEWRDARLPTEAEWEKAARGTDGRAYPWGSEFDCSLANHSGCIGDTAAVNQYDKGQSIYGVYGMSGNVWEWTSTLYRLYPYSATDGREDPDTAGNRVIRGGSWHFFGGNGSIYAYTRFKVDASYSGLYVGFRCALAK